MTRPGRRKVLEQLLVEASSNNARMVSAGSLTLADEGTIDWAEKSRRGLVARSGRVDWETFWRLVDEALS